MQRKFASKSTAAATTTAPHLIKFNFGEPSTNSNRNYENDSLVAHHHQHHRTRSSSSTITPLKRLRLLVSKALTCFSAPNAFTNTTTTTLSHGDVPLVLGACRILHNASFLNTTECRAMVKNAVDAALAENLDTRNKVNAYVRLLWFVAAPTQGRTGRLLPAASASAVPPSSTASSSPSSLSSSSAPPSNPFQHEFERMCLHSHLLIDEIQTSMHERFSAQLKKNEGLQRRVKTRIQQKKKIISIKALTTSIEEDSHHQLAKRKKFASRQRFNRTNLTSVRSTDVSQISAAIIRGLSSSSSESNNNNNSTIKSSTLSFEFVLNLLDCWTLLSMKEKRMNPKAIHLTLLSGARILKLLNCEGVQRNAAECYFVPPSQHLHGIKQPLDDEDAQLLRRRRLIYRRAIINFTEAFHQRMMASGVTVHTTGYRGNSLFEHELKEICMALLDTFIWNEKKPIIDRPAMSTVRHLYRMLYRRARTVSKFTQGEIGPAMRMLHYVVNNSENIRRMRSTRERREFLMQNCAAKTVVKVSCSSKVIKEIPINGVNLVLALMKARELRRIKDLIAKERKSIDADRVRVQDRFGYDDDDRIVNSSSSSTQHQHEEKTNIFINKNNNNNHTHNRLADDTKTSQNDDHQQQQQNRQERNELAYLEEEGLVATATSDALDEPEMLSTHHRGVMSKTFQDVKVASSSNHNSTGDTEDAWLDAVVSSASSGEASTKSRLSILGGGGEQHQQHQQQPTINTTIVDDFGRVMPSATSSTNELRKEAKIVAPVKKSLEELSETDIASLLLIQGSSTNGSGGGMNKFEPNHAWVKLLPTQALDQNTAVTIFLRQIAHNVKHDTNLQFLLSHDDYYLLKLVVSKTSDWIRHVAERSRQPVAARWGFGKPIRITVQSLALLPSRLTDALQLPPSSPTMKFVSLVVQKLIQDVFLPPHAPLPRPVRTAHEERMKTHVGLKDGGSITSRKFNRSFGNRNKNNNNNNYDASASSGFTIEKSILAAQTRSPTAHLEGYFTQSKQERLREEIEDKIVVAEFAADAPNHVHQIMHDTYSRTSALNANRSSSGFYSLAFVADMLRMIRWCSLKSTWSDQGLISTLTEEGNECAAAILFDLNQHQHQNQNRQYQSNKTTNRINAPSAVSHNDLRSLIEIVLCLQRFNVDIFVEARAIIDLLFKVDFNEFICGSKFDRTALVVSELKSLRASLKGYLEVIQREKEQEEKERVVTAPVANLLELAQQRAKMREQELQQKMAKTASGGNVKLQQQQNQQNGGMSSSKEQQRLRMINESDLEDEMNFERGQRQQRQQQNVGSSIMMTMAMKKEKAIIELYRRVSSAITRNKYAEQTTQ